MTNSPSHRLRLPIITHVKLSSFSLYALNPSPEIDIPRGVFCLAGANGLGKSTFLSAVNYAMTGIVPDPSRGFASVEEYFKYNLGFSAEYFDGKITESDRETAAIAVHLRIGSHRYEIVRGVFEKEELRSLTIFNDASGRHEVDTGKMTATERNLVYRSHITGDVGLESFEQFVFLEQLVLTFDERRHLLLWDKRVLEQALYLSFGTDHEKALRAGELRREIEKADSRARNYNFKATDLRNRWEYLSQLIGTDQGDATDDLDSLMKQHKAVQDAVDRQQKDVEQKSGRLRDAELALAQESAKMMAVDADYEQLFSQHVSNLSGLPGSSLVSNSVSQQCCPLCGRKTAEIANAITKKLEVGICPLCEAELPPENRESAAENLRELDKELRHLRERVDGAIRAKERIALELQKSQSEFENLTSNLREFERQNEAALRRIQARETGLKGQVDALKKEFEELIKKKEAEYKDRDRLRRQLVALQSELMKSYLSAEKDFLPLFQQLAKLFLGVDLEIRMDANESVTSYGLSLVLEVKGTARREYHQLSESQRFFLDIALRMALAQYMSTNGATLFVDTPEGSLDIAYESRAGQMFASFVKNGHNVIMTANINSSQILKKLAAECGRSRMELCRMTSWAELSEVQLQEEDLFRQAIEEIHKTLDSAVHEGELKGLF